MNERQNDMAHKRFRVGDYDYDPAAAELRGLRRRVRLRPQTAALLDLLLANSAEVISREKIRETLWSPQMVLEFDPAISACVKQLRQALKDSAVKPAYIETIPKKGYRLIARVSCLQEPESQIESGSFLTGLRSRLGWLISASVLGVIVLASVLWRQSDSDTDRVLLIVMPLQAMGEQAELAAMADTFTDRLISALGIAAPGRVGVISRTTAFAIREQSLTAGELRQRFGAHFLIEGTLRSLGDEVLLSTSLIATDDQSLVWSELIEVSGRQTGEISNAVEYVSEAVIMTVAPDFLPPIAPLQVIRLSDQRSKDQAQ